MYNNRSQVPCLVSNPWALCMQNIFAICLAWKTNNSEVRLRRQIREMPSLSLSDLTRSWQSIMPKSARLASAQVFWCSVFAAGYISYTKVHLIRGTVTRTSISKVGCCCKNSQINGFQRSSAPGSSLICHTASLNSSASLSPSFSFVW